MHRKSGGVFDGEREGGVHSFISPAACSFKEEHPQCQQQCFGIVVSIIKT